MTFKLFQNLNLGLKLNAIIALAFTMLLATIVMITNQSMNNFATQTGQQRLKQEAEVIQKRFEEAERSVLADAKSLISTFGLAQAVANQETNQLRTFASIGTAQFNFDDLDVVDGTGEQILTVTEVGKPFELAEDNAFLSLALLGIESTGIIIEEEALKLELYLNATLPLHDKSGTIVGGLFASREVDDAFLKQINLSRQDIHLVLITGQDVLAIDQTEDDNSDSFNSTVFPEESVAQRVLNGEVVITDNLVLNQDGISHRLAYAPVTVGRNQRVIIAILVEMDELFAFQRQLITRATFISILLGLIVMGTMAWFTRRSIALPISRLTLVVKRMAASDYSQRADVTTSDEIGQLADAFNQMAGAIQSQDKELRENQQHLRELAETLTVARDELESRVVERTIELAQSNQRLALKIEQLQETEGKLQLSLEEKTILLKEIHHRVKNNLQIISSLLYLQSLQLEDDTLLAMFQESQQRVKSIALIHEQLYQTENLARIDFADYVEKLTTQLSRSYKQGHVQLAVNIPTLPLTVEKAIPCGLMINELVTNAFKYAFPDGQAGTIAIAMQLTQEGQLTLTVKDNGVGFPTDLNWQRPKSLGLTLVKTLVKQLHGTIELRSEAGTEFKIIFTDNTVKPYAAKSRTRP